MDFLDECEGENCVFTMYCITTMYVIFQKSMESAHWSIFFSGARSIPPAGWPKKPTLEFLHDNTILPTSSTCSLILRLPIVHTSSEMFKNAMVLSIKGNDGFGGP